MRPMAPMHFPGVAQPLRSLMIKYTFPSLAIATGPGPTPKRFEPAVKYTTPLVGLMTDVTLGAPAAWAANLPSSLPRNAFAQETITLSEAAELLNVRGEPGCRVSGEDGPTKICGRYAPMMIESCASRPII